MRPSTPALCAAASTLAACTVSAWPVARHTAPPSFDEAWYLEVSYRFWNALSRGAPLDFAREWAGALRFKAPLISLIPLPLYALRGPSFEAARLANLPALALLAVSLYGLGRRFFSPAAGALAATSALLMPMSYALSRLYFVECWLMALSAAFLWRWVESETLERASEAPRLGALAGLGLLTKVLFPLPLLGPVALTLYERRAGPRELERPVKALAVVAAALALTWYGPNLIYVAGYTVRASAGDIAGHYAAGSAFSPRLLARFFDAMARDGLSYPLTLALLASLAALGRRRVLRESGLRFALAWLAFPLLAASLGRSKELRFAAAGLPGAALALAGALDLLTRGKPSRPWLFALVLVWPVDLWARHTFGTSVLPLVHVGPWALSAPRTVYGGPPSTAGDRNLPWLASEVFKHIDGPAVVVLGAEHGTLNANLLAAEAALRRYPHTYVHYGHMADRVEATVARLSEKDATHILFVSGLPAEEQVPGVPALDAALKALIASGRLPFRPQARLDWESGGLTAELYERTGPIRMTGR